MDNLQNTLNNLLKNPDIMKKVQDLAQNMGTQPGSAPSFTPPSGSTDWKMLGQLSGLLGQSDIDPNQKSLLQALRPYVNQQRLSRLERAMRAAKMAGIASALMKEGR